MIDASEVDSRHVPRHAAAVVAVELDGQAVLYHEELGAVYVLNPTATVVWECLDGSATIDALCAELAEAFSVDVATVREDVLNVVRQFAEQGLLHEVAADPDVVASHVVHPGAEVAEGE
jgi:PqqD family protein of HPr-rel-A system